MTIQHHPNFESLMSCSAGSMPEAFAAVMASHISVCPACRKELALMEDIGVELFSKIAPAAITREAPIAVMRRAEADGEPHDAAAALPGASSMGSKPGGMPAPLAPLAGPDLERVAWRRLAPGIQHFPIPLSPGAKGHLRLVKVAPGAVLPTHDHGGTELTLVLKGSYSDVTGQYRAGDVSDIAEGIEHSPLADAKEGCVCLIASDQKIRFKSLMARLWQPFTGL